MVELSGVTNKACTLITRATSGWFDIVVTEENYNGNVAHMIPVDL